MVRRQRLRALRASAKNEARKILPPDSCGVLCRTSEPSLLSPQPLLLKISAVENLYLPVVQEAPRMQPNQGPHYHPSRRSPMSINQDKLHEFLGKAIVDFGATFNAALIRIGDKLGLYKALASGGPQTPAELAKRTGTAERYVREWLSAQAAGGYVTYDSSNGKF